MRSALLCVFFTLIILIERIHAQDDDFKPMPIPLDWHQDRRAGRAGTLHETFRTDSPPTVAAVPAHYWEDALRHSVYLTLVRDKIDQLIAKGDFISPNNKPGGYDSKEIDDHDLWDKIKTAPFDRIQDEEPGSFGDVTIMAKGRLLENEGGFRFAEDERSKEKCSDDNCMRGVKAFWSVKRVRQRDQETSPGKYHYELTFSVISQMPKKQKKPHENPIRTFTVKESTPNSVTDRPQYRKFGNGPIQTARPERAIWFHKNIAPAKQTGRKYYFQGLDRIFSSIFSEDEEKTYDVPLQKYRQNHFGTQPAPLYSKIGHVGVPNEQHQQIPFVYRHPAKYGRPPLQAPPISSIQHQYLDTGVIGSSNGNPYAPHSYDHRLESSQTVKTTRPAVLPTPLPHKGQSSEVTNMMSSENIDNTSTAPDTTKIYKPYNKYKATPVKFNYFSDHVRPPIYNAPPGVFVTMDKKPFKPMPPLKLMHSSKPHRTNKPIDFKPSPQVLDVQSTDSFSDSAFRPITINFSDSNATETLEVIDTTKKNENKIRKPTTVAKKPTKKHNNIKSQRTTTATPDIITAQSSSGEEIETMDWANLLGAFTKTTPMVSQTEKTKISETTTPMTILITTPMTTSTAKTRPTTTTTEAQQASTVSTTVRPIKRTRPPPKFVKQDQIKKHKRITTTSTSTTTTNAPETIIKKRPSYDLSPQASSAPTGITKSTKFHRESNNKTQTNISSSTTTTTTTTTTTKPTTSKTTTVTTQSPSTTTTEKSISSTTQSKSKNRFRQSTLMVKGTSVKHDRWNGVQQVQKNQTATSSSSAQYTYRRKGSNFQGYLSSTTPRQIDEEKQKEKESHVDRKPSLSTESNTVKTTSQTNPNYDVTVERYETNSVLPLGRLREHNENNDKHSDEDYEDESKDHSEFIFQPTTETQTSVQIISEPNAQATNKTKCKKKKTNIPTTQESNDISSEIFGTTTKSYATISTTKTPTEIPTTNDILQDFLNFNFKDDDEKDLSHTSRADLQKQESINHESFLKIDDFEDFLDIHLTDSKRKHSDQIADDDQYNNDDEDDVDGNNDDDDDDDEDEYENSKVSSIDDFQTEDDKEESETNSNTKQKHPYSLLELMAMS